MRAFITFMTQTKTYTGSNMRRELFQYIFILMLLIKFELSTSILYITMSQINSPIDKLLRASTVEKAMIVERLVL